MASPEPGELPGPPVAGAQDLAWAYAAGGEELAGVASAEAVLCARDEIVVLCTVTEAGGRARTGLLALGITGDIRWQRELAADHGAGRAIAALPDGRYVVAAELQASPGAFEGRLLRLDAGGQIVSERSLGDGSLSTVAVLADGSTLAGGSRQRAGWLVHADEDRTIEDVDAIASVVALAGGAHVRAATRERSTTSLALARITACGPDGAQRWDRDLPDSGRGELVALAALDDGDVVAAGHREADAASPAALWVVRLTASGDVTWERELPAAGQTRRGRAVAPLPGGDVAVGGDAARGSGRIAIVARLDEDGTVVWERAFDDADAMLRGLVATADGGLVLAGSATSADSNRSVALVRCLDGDGSERWSRTFA